MKEGEGEGEVAFFSPKRWDHRNRADLIESATPCYDAQVVWLYQDSIPLRLTILGAIVRGLHHDTITTQHFDTGVCHQVFRKVPSSNDQK